MQTVYIGTKPLELSSPNVARLRWSLEFKPSSIVAGNTGLIYVGRGFVPNAVDGDPNCGDVLNAGSFIDEAAAFQGDTLPFKGAIWAVSDTANQECTYDEETVATPTPGAIVQP